MQDVAGEILLLAAMAAIMFGTACNLHLAPPAAIVVALGLVACGRALVGFERRAKTVRRKLRRT